MTKEKLDYKEAYLAMYEFINSLHKRIGSDDLACLLSDMMLMDDGTPVDSAVWSDWMDAIEKSQNKNFSDIGFKLFK